MAYCTSDEVREVLRLDGTPTFDESRIDRSVAVATEIIDSFLDRPAVNPLGPVPETVHQAAINLAVEEYRRPGAAFGLLGFNDLDGAALRLPASHLIGVRSLLLPHKGQWGVG